MRINCHAHIFNVQCVLTTETIAIIVRRLSQTPVAFAADGVKGVLESLRDNPRYLSEEDLLRLLLDKIGASAAFKKALKKLPVPDPIFEQFGILDQLPMAVLREILDALSTHFDRADAPGGGVFDIFMTLRIALKPNCTAVADELLAEMNSGDGLVALMMDITSPTEPDRDRQLFERQLRETREAMLQRPGRIFPFVAVNTRRKSHKEVLERAVNQMGFVGVKLYPSLGYQIHDSEEMVDVVDFCAEKDLPITMHCNHGGFSADSASVLFCDPEHWVDHLARKPETKVCFAHFGGIDGLFSSDPADKEWTDHIVQLMNDFDNVYADISFHVDMMVDKEKEKRYFATLRSFLQHPIVGQRILFGTDSWLLRMHLGERNYWHYFEQRLTSDEFKQIADVNPHRFLGLPDGAGAPRANIARYVDVMRTNRLEVGAAPAAWLKTAVSQDFVVKRFPPHWTPNNPAHMVANFVLRDHMTKAQKDAGFTIAGTLHLRELLYFHPGVPTPEIFVQQCEAIAAMLCRVAIKQTGTALEIGMKEEEALDAVQALLVSGEETIAVMGGLIDSLFRFAGEPQ